MESTDTNSVGGKATSLRPLARLAESRSSIISRVTNDVVCPGTKVDEVDGGGGTEREEGTIMTVPSIEFRPDMITYESIISNNTLSSPSKEREEASPLIIPPYPEIKSKEEGRNDRGIVDAARQANQGEVIRLFNDGVSLESVDNNGYTPLITVCCCHPQDFVSAIAVFNYLISIGARVNVVSGVGQSALYYAAMNSYEAFVSGLLLAGADANIQSNCGETPLMMAAERCHLGIGRELIAGGADLNIQCHNGDTALMRAATCCRVEFVSLLIGAGAGIDIQNSKGLSALWKTFITNRSAFSSTMIVRKLLSAGADPDLQYDGDTPLMYTAAYGYESIARELIAGGADINIKDAEGWTALRLAVANDQRTIVALLLMEGAHDDDDEAFNLAVRLNRPYGNRGAWDDLRWRWTFSKLKTALSSAKAASKAPYLVATPTTPLQNFFHRRESLNVLEKIVSFLRSTTNEPLDRRFIDTPSASETHEEAQEEDESLWWD